MLSCDVLRLAHETQGARKRKKVWSVQDWAKGFYLGKPWKQCSKAYMKSQNYICERCGEPAKICHHKIYLTRNNINNPYITLCWDNLEALCQDCHNKEHHKTETKLRYSFDEEGNIIYPPSSPKNLRGRIPRGILQKYPAGARVRGVGGGVSRKGRYLMTSKKEKTKEQRIKSENTRLKGVFKELDENKKKIVTPLIQKAAFMHVELEELQKVIEEEGCVCEYKNGENQYGTKKSPEVDVYNTMIKNYTAIIKTLAELAPAAQKKKKSGLALLREE